METKTSSKLTIEFEDDEAARFKSAIRKVSEEIMKPGLKNNSITTEEADTIKTLADKLN